MPDPDDPFDVAVIGAGVVGCAIARRLALDGARVVVLERAADILDGASKANSAILHTGFDAPPGSLEAACVAAGHAEYLEIRERLNLPVDRCGALVLAWTEAEAEALPGLMEQAHANGVDDVQPLSATEVQALEPALAAGVQGGFRVPREYLIDPWSAPYAYLLQAVAHGACVLRGAGVTGGVFDGVRWRLETDRGPVQAGAVVNAAGLHGDRVEALLTGKASFRIRPRKGQFVVFDKPAARLVRHILLPVPSPTTKGIVLCRTIWGNLLVGPTAEEQDDRENAGLDGATLAMLRARGEAVLPGLRGIDVTATYAGLRPASEEKHYRLRVETAMRYVTVGGIRSTGLSAALGLARHVAGLMAGFLAPGAAPAEPLWPQVPNLAETAPRRWQGAGHGGVICHCELVTRAEVEEALSGPLPARSLSGLKRRTRVTMGRCQGFCCLPEIAAVTAGRLAVPVARPAGT